ncbi:MAG: carbohydrate binding family 9 domain-containing protein, partial [Candidatus Latescibacteria bacterium]|nr:carbohydrate binding family 9 domain-containing protein [Candidatus Latescibacterota bacterium]
MIESDNQFLVCSIYNYLLAVSLIIFTEVFFPAALASAAQEADEYDNKVIHAIRINERIKLDGILNDSVWQSVEPTTDLVQREPVEGQQPLQKTEVRFLYDYAALYIGVICHDSEPEKIVHNELVRDGAVMYDDNFLVMLDTYSNKRTGWYFCINPNGAKLDAVVTGFKEFSTDWDGVWYGEAKMLTDGWSAEISIPFSTLRFPNTEKQIWGINFCRVLPRDNFIQDIWSSWHLNDGMTQLTKAGKLVGIEGITGSRQMDFVPYVSGAQERLEGKARDLSLKYGADIKYGITSNLTLTLTTHTDFAQAEADEEQINLTRFSIYYPEKRSFFLESGEIFSFAEGEKQSTIFYSRTIGLTTDRELVPILAGGKLAGKANGYEIGVLSMQTKEKSGYPSSNYSVFRLKRNFLRKSFVGIMATNLSENGDNRNQAVGMDYAFKTDSFMENKNLEIDGYLAGTSTEGLSGDNLSGKIKIRLPNDLFDYYSLYRFVEP